MRTILCALTLALSACGAGEPGNAVVPNAAAPTVTEAPSALETPIATVEAATRSTPPGVVVGAIAPDFDLPGSDGQSHKLSDYQGQHVVLAFFPKAFTGGWTLQCKALRDSDQEIQNYNVSYFMASTDTIEDNTAFAVKNDASFPILADTTKAVSESYGVLGARGFAGRVTFYIDPQGTIARIDREVNPRTAGTDLVAALQVLGVPKSG